VGLPDLARGVETIQERHRDIHHDHVWRSDAAASTRSAVRDRADHVAGIGQQSLERLEQEGVIVCEKHAGFVMP